MNKNFDFENALMFIQGKAYKMDPATAKTIYRNLIDIESHLSLFYSDESDELYSGEQTFINEAFAFCEENISIATWEKLTTAQKIDYFNGNARVAKLIDFGLQDSKDFMPNQSAVKELLEEYLYTQFYDVYSGEKNCKPSIKALPIEFLEDDKNRDILKAALLNSIVRNHMNKKKSNLVRVEGVLDSLIDQRLADESGDQNGR